MNVEPVVFEGKHVRLEPMRVDHLPALCDVGLEPSLWKWTGNVVESAADIEVYVRNAMSERDRGTALPFVTIERRSN